MEQQQVHASSFYRPSLGDELLQSFDRPVEGGLELASFDQCQTVGDVDDSQLIGTSEMVSIGSHDAVAGEAGSTVNLAEKSVVEKRRRGRPPGSGRLPKGSVKTTALLRKKEDEDDVCFVCFDGGSLVLCDRRGCPKAYHPACIKRDEAFFQSNAKWNCGWHICNTCQKASYYMCYTCPYSLCKGCTKDADYQCIRGSKGLCGTCMRTVMLIENLQENKEMVQVDFDDKSSWEYLFKVYWTFLKCKLLLTSDELITAKNPWKAASVIASTGESSCEFHNMNNDKSVSSNSYTDVDSINLKRGRTNKKPIIPNTNAVSIDESDGHKEMPIPGNTTWASKDLLEFVSHMKNGDLSVLSKFDVQELLLDYIQKNSLRDPRKKCQIDCDSRLLSLFGKSRLGHFEMLKLLDSHFLMKEETLVDHTGRVGLVEAVSSQMESGRNHDNQTMVVNNKRRKMHERVSEGGPQPDPDAYAAIDVHNINLIYLRRHLMENLMDDAEKFHDKVVGSIVRIKVSGSDQKQDNNRLVQVVGTSKVKEHYNLGTKTTDVMLEILNLNKKEVIPIDGISNEEFSQDECERLRQIIKCGLIKCLTVHEVQEKARALLAVKLSDWLELEVMRLNHLRDHASERGHGKELQECVEKLQLLSSREEYQRRLQEVPVVHSDSSMDRSFESEGIAREIDEKTQDKKDNPVGSGLGRKRKEPVSPRRSSGIAIKNRGKAHKLCVTPRDQTRGKETFGRNDQNTTKNNAHLTGSVNIDWSNGEVVQSDLFSGVPLEISVLPLSSETNQPMNDMETDKMWNYQDPTGKVQGPFSLIHLRKWSLSGQFPSNLTVWRINEKQDSSVLLTKALTGENSKEPLLVDNSHLGSYDNSGDGQYDQRNNGTSATPVDDKRFNANKNAKQDGPSKYVDSDNESAINEKGPHSSICTTIMGSGEGHIGVFLQGCDSLKDINVSTNLVTAKQDPIDQVGEGQGCERTSAQHDECFNAHQNTKSRSNNNHKDYEHGSDSEGHSGQSSEQNWGHTTVSSSTCGTDFKRGFVSPSKQLKTSVSNQEVINFLNVPCHAPKLSDGNLECKPADKKHIQSSNAPVHDAGVSWSTISRIVAGPHQHEVAGEWGACSPTLSRPSIEEWNSSLVSESSLKPTEVASDCAVTSASVNNQLAHSFLPHPASHASSWLALVTEPDDFCSLADESVSDLLAEVEEMETLHRLSSSQSIINYGQDLTDGSKNDCVSSVEAFNPAPEPGKGDALSSTSDVHLSLQLTVTSEPLGEGKSDYLYPQKRVNGKSSSGEIEGDKKHSDVPVNQLEAGADIQPAVPSTAR